MFHNLCAPFSMSKKFGVDNFDPGLFSDFAKTHHHPAGLFRDPVWAFRPRTPARPNEHRGDFQRTGQFPRHGADPPRRFHSSSRQQGVRSRLHFLHQWHPRTGSTTTGQAGRQTAKMLALGASPAVRQIGIRFQEPFSFSNPSQILFVFQCPTKGLVLAKC